MSKIMRDWRALRELARREPDGRVRDRLRAVALAREGQAAPQVAQALGYSRRSVQAWVLRYNAGGAAALPDRKGRGWTRGRCRATGCAPCAGRTCGGAYRRTRL